MTSKILTLISFLLLSSCGIQSIPKSKNAVEASVAEVTNQYKRRADLIPNLVKVVKSYAKHEKETLEGVVKARANATSMKIDASSLTPEKMKAFQAAQGQLGNAIGRLLMLRENYPDLKANQNFRDLQAQLEGAENRITVARQRLIQSINAFNNLVTVPPTSWTNSIMYNHEKMQQWTVENAKEIEKAPSVDL